MKNENIEKEHLVLIKTYKKAVVSKDTYDHDWDALIRGEEVPCEWDEYGTPIAWDCLSEYN